MQLATCVGICSSLLHPCASQPVRVPRLCVFRGAWLHQHRCFCFWPPRCTAAAALLTEGWLCPPCEDDAFRVQQAKGCRWVVLSGKDGSALSKVLLWAVLKAKKKEGKKEIAYKLFQGTGETVLKLLLFPNATFIVVTKGLVCLYTGELNN